MISLGIHVHKYYLHWALKSVSITYIGLFGSLGYIMIYQEFCRFHLEALETPPTHSVSQMPILTLSLGLRV